MSCFFIYISIPHTCTLTVCKYGHIYYITLFCFNFQIKRCNKFPNVTNDRNNYKNILKTPSRERCNMNRWLVCALPMDVCFMIKCLSIEFPRPFSFWLMRHHCTCICFRIFTVVSIDFCVNFGYFARLSVCRDF